MSVFLLQPYITKPLFGFDVNFTMQIIIGTIISFGVMMVGNKNING
ncbi:MAG: hypothetical protein IE880_07865 [Epsilonproteobacteria bacterium]|nr:hypothetical protein [Campylobacterota bacterium]